jgi:hypothetical protein
VPTKPGGNITIMPQRAYLMFGDIEDKLDVLRVECTKCARKGRYSVRRRRRSSRRRTSSSMMDRREALLLVERALSVGRATQKS